MSDIRNGVAVITLDNPPVNSLGHALRERIVLQLEQAQANPDVNGIVLAGNEKAFSAGADVTEFGTPRQLQEPILRTVLARVEASGKPVVAAIAGVALGGGLELALACHGRVALASARVGLPEISLGLIPGSGGTQRLPRLMGIAAAQALMASGQPQTARQLQGAGLFNAVVDEDVVGEAVRLANTLATQGEPYPRARDRVLDVVEVQAEVGAQRAKLNARQKLQPAYGALLDALAASALPFEEGLQKERELFLALVPSTAAQALRYQFKVEREATKLPAELHAPARPVRTVAVIGAGTMGTGIAIAALDAGLAVLLLEQDEAALNRGRERIAGHYADRVAAGKLAADKAAANEARLSTTLDWVRLQDADLVIEAVFEDLAVKQEVFRRIDTHARPGAVLATNTSYLDVDAIAAATSRPQDVLGLHFFSPANVMKLLEVVRGAQTTLDVLATGMAVGAALKKTPVLTGNAFGFIGNRIYNAYRRQCEFMLEDGAWPEDVDNALTGFGFAMGPFAVADLSGLDIAWRMRKAQAWQRDPRERYVDILDQLCEIGRLGRKAGAGYYTYADGKQVRTTDSAVREVIQQASARRGIARRTLTPEEIQRRALLAMVNEAAKLIAEGIAARPSDVDVVLVQGYGFPRWEGGPVFWARQQDRSQLEADLRQLAAEAGHGFALADLSPLFTTSVA
ncbi:3-hydroxyacyl-CoA dehydrogenase NAD-binding domain-containing protein [Burkholderia contaminans]|jgi:3-hydroxyacyl-CoA dehydrogenase|nr:MULTISPECIES: 3-hydroxyacyl-CoA dehydrogenase NAD-binding domain-containing protein [Burkholderiaceae]MBA9860107.1 3-hydroxyacyl-CoA dehydrogenase [Ralstonia insidiosa]MBA9940914.1 3-hydroxyacyl-CoA dehydrogenase [Ralstonia insidiosa]MBX3905255.1 enoyl-CoA hydratase/isomerase family protein [Ralstonia insidiosa]MDN7577268.1 3-hydroxyacyl-CoA dehydrogenase NAD-binding domain-containing protein [Burkholderia contaminans]NPT52264.1 3-hydroxyacyl-CoA dehydrogenase [Ralstonia sp. 3N]